MRAKAKLPIAAGLVTAAALALAGGVAVGVGTDHAEAQAAHLGSVNLTQTSGNVNDTPMFGNGTTSAPCPDTFGEEASLRIGPARPEGPFSNLAPAVGGGGFDEAPVSIDPNRSFATTLGAPPEDGEWWVVVECFSLTEGRHPERFVTPIEVCGTLWQVNACTATPTETALAVAPTSLAEADVSVSLTATITPATVPGEVEFTTTVEGGAEPVALGTAAVTSGTAALPAVTAMPVGWQDVTASFTPTDSAAFASSSGTVTEYLVYEPANPIPTRIGSVVGAPGPGTDPLPVGTEITVTATIQPAPATGTVRFERVNPTSQATALGTAEVTGGTATFAVDDLPEGLWRISATFTASEGSDFADSAAFVGEQYEIGGSSPSPSPSPTQSPSPSPSPSASPSATDGEGDSGGDGDGNGDGNGGGGGLSSLASTGFPLAGLLAAGLVMLAAGTGAFRFARSELELGPVPWPDDDDAKE